MHTVRCPRVSTPRSMSNWFDSTPNFETCSVQKFGTVQPLPKVAKFDVFLLFKVTQKIAESDLVLNFIPSGEKLLFDIQKLGFTHTIPLCGILPKRACSDYLSCFSSSTVNCCTPDRMIIYAVSLRISQCPPFN